MPVEPYAPPVLLPRVPTYTLPFAIVGTVNFTALPAASGPESGLLQSSRSVSASYARSTAGPQPWEPGVQ